MVAACILSALVAFPLGIAVTVAAIYITVASWFTGKAYQPSNKA